jgi:hypothetical protein
MYTTPQNDVLTSVTVSDDVANSDPIVFKGFTGGLLIVHPDSSSPTTTINYYVASTEGGTYYELKNASGAVQDTVAVEKAWPLPAELKGAAFIKLLGNNAGVVDLHLTSS